MDCREAQQRIFAERDGALDNSQRAALVAHTTHCASCREMRDRLATAIDSWRTSTRGVSVPDAELEWQKIRREIRGGASATVRGVRLGWFALPVAAAAAIAVTFFVNPAGDGSPAPKERTVARAHVEASVENASPVVFVDDKSGWVFVWAATDEPKRI